MYSVPTISFSFYFLNTVYKQTKGKRTEKPSNAKCITNALQMHAVMKKRNVSVQHVPITHRLHTPFVKKS